MNPLRSLKRLVLTLLAVAGSATGSAVADFQRSEGWTILAKVDSFDGPTVTVQSPDQHLMFTHYRKDNQTVVWLSLPSEVRCPYSEESPESSVPQSYAMVRWKIDDGIVHGQRFDLVTPRDLSYRLSLDFTDPPEEIEKYRTFGDTWSTVQRKTMPELANKHKIDPNELLILLSNGRTLLLRADGKCGYQNVQVNLVGLASALRRARILPILSSSQ